TRRRRARGGRRYRFAGRGADRPARDRAVLRFARGQLRGRSEGRLMATYPLGRGSPLREVDLVTVGAVAALIVIGLLSIFTATVDPEQGTLLGFQASSALFNKQLVFLVLAVATLIAAMAIDYRYLKVYAMISY